MRKVSTIFLTRKNSNVWTGLSKTFQNTNSDPVTSFSQIMTWYILYCYYYWQTWKNSLIKIKLVETRSQFLFHVSQAMFCLWHKKRKQKTINFDNYQASARIKIIQELCYKESKSNMKVLDKHWFPCFKTIINSNRQIANSWRVVNSMSGMTKWLNCLVFFKQTESTLSLYKSTQKIFRTRVRKELRAGQIRPNNFEPLVSSTKQNKSTNIFRYFRSIKLNRVCTKQSHTKQSHTKKARKKTKMNKKTVQYKTVRKTFPFKNCCK